MRILLTLLGVAFLGTVAAIGGVLALFWYYGQGLPDYRQLADYKPQVMTRVHAGDGRLIAEYARQRRVFVPIEAIPSQLIGAFLAAEDKNFYTHPGIDVPSLVRAVVTNIANYGSGRRPVGASTITQQVAKNFLLTNEVSFERKIKEAILSFRIERAYSKDHILELYLNEIYLGRGAYGVAAAALRYFDKSLDELNIAESAYLAALPKAPSRYDPHLNYDAAKARRDWVVGRMQQEGFIDTAAAKAALAQDLTLAPRRSVDTYRADYFAEEVRRELVARYGEEALYDGGLSVRTTVAPALQTIADRALRDGLIAYDRRHGWRGPLRRIALEGDWRAALTDMAMPELPEGYPWQRAVVRQVDAQAATIDLEDGRRGQIPLEELHWARAWREGQRLGPEITAASQVLAPGDVVLVEALSAQAGAVPLFGLRQIPEVNGALVAMDPHTGRVLAMSGGFSFAASKFNRATQAARQPGSAFKPFVYLAALESGFTPSTLILDAPFVIDQGPGLGKWKPANYTRKFYGPSTMRLGIEKSRNLMTVRLAQTLGMDRVAEYAERFGVVDTLPRQLSMALGAGETTLMRMTAAYAMLVNGGKRITPSLIDRIQDRRGRVIYRRDARPCTGCDSRGTAPPHIRDTRAQLADPQSAFQIVSMLEGVVQRGTGRRIAALGRPLAGKTGTTNRGRDSWFVGFSPDLAVGVYVGFDTPRPLGPREGGSSVAAPIFKDFMGAALKDEKAIPFRTPEGIRLVRVNARTGLPAQPGEKGVIWEAFKPGSLPTAQSAVLEGASDGVQGTPASGPTGIY